MLRGCRWLRTSTDRGPAGTWSRSCARPAAGPWVNDDRQGLAKHGHWSAPAAKSRWTTTRRAERQFGSSPGVVRTIRCRVSSPGPASHGPERDRGRCPVTTHRLIRLAAGPLLLLALVVGPLSSPAHAHCDTMDGPVVASAKAALEKGSVTPVLRWVSKEHEDEIREAFAKVTALRAKAPEAAEIADRWFFETLVRVHREGEGATYSGLKPAGTDPGPGVREADRALETGNPDSLVKALTEAVSEGVKHRLHRVLETRRHADDSVEAGREHVEAYVQYVHYIEELHLAATGSLYGHGEGEEGGSGHR